MVLKSRPSFVTEDSLHDQVHLLARKAEQALALSPPAEIARFLKEMANRHHTEWAGAETIKAFDG